MVVGKTQVAVDALVRAIAARDVHRVYLALAHGPWRGEPERWVDQAIGRDPRNRLRMGGPGQWGRGREAGADPGAAGRSPTAHREAETAKAHRG